MTGFAYRNGVLHAEGVALPRIAEAVGTPTYIYSASLLEANYRAYETAFGGQNVGIHFALKANGNLGVVALLASLGAGADIVSLGEMKRAMAAGIAPADLVFSGVGKTRDELAEAIRLGVAQINVESEPELEALNDVARALGRRQRIVLRVNPDVDARTHEKISTGKKGDKFGIPYDQVPDVYRRAAEMDGVEMAGIAVHIGSQLTDLTPFRSAYGKLAELVRALRADGLPVQEILGQRLVRLATGALAAAVREGGLLLLEPGSVHEPHPIPTLVVNAVRLQRRGTALNLRPGADATVLSSADRNSARAFDKLSDAACKSPRLGL